MSVARYGEHKYMTVNGVRIHYVESGDVSKPLLLFVHGWPQFWYSWRNQIEYFNKVRVHFVQQTEQFLMHPFASELPCCCHGHERLQ